MKKRIFTILLAGVLLCGLLPTAAFAADASILPGTDKENITLYGRNITDSTGTLRLFWTNSGFAVKVNGSTVSADISATAYGENTAAYLNVYVDGSFVPTKTIRIGSSGTYALAEGLPTGEHIVEVRKRNEAVDGGSATVTVSKLTTDGQFLTPPAQAARQIEFVGDSITSGYGNLVTDGSGVYTTATVEGTMTWAVLAAKQLGAEAQVLCRSGIGYCRNTTMHTVADSSFYPYYTKTASLPNHRDGDTEWDFKSHPSDVVVINLGSNDDGGTYTSGADKGKKITDEYMTSEAVAFLELVREKNPDAVIIWNYGMTGTARTAALEKAVAERNAAGDTKVFFLAQTQFSTVTEGKGTNGHPTVQANINRSDELARFIAEKTGWEWDASAMLKAQLQLAAQYTTEESLSALIPASVKAFTETVAAGEQLLKNENATNDELIAASEAVWHAWYNRRLNSDIQSNYILVDSCDDRTGVTLAGSRKGLDSEDKKEGEYALYTSGTGNLSIHHTKHPNNFYNIDMPEDATEWFFECWLYIDKPENLPKSATLEVAQEQDKVEIAWSLHWLLLQPGWNKIQLPLTALPSNFKTLHNIRLYLQDVTDPLVVKMDHIVLSRGRLAENTAALNSVIAATNEFLAENSSAPLTAALAVAQSAASQADVDAATKDLAVALAAAKEAAKEAAKLGDVDGKGTVDSTDARLVLQYAVKKIDAAALDLTVADVDGNKAVDSTDARLILQYAVGKIEKFPTPQ